MVWNMQIGSIRELFYAHSEVGDRAFGDTFFSFDDRAETHGPPPSLQVGRGGLPDLPAIQRRPADFLGQ